MALFLTPPPPYPAVATHPRGVPTSKLCHLQRYGKNTWVHFGLQRHNGVFTFYMNGKKIGSQWHDTSSIGPCNEAYEMRLGAL